MARHGRATIPFGKFRGTRLRCLPLDYLSFLTTLPMMRAPQWRWLKESLYAELRFRGMNTQGLEAPDAAPEVKTLQIVSKRAIRIGERRAL